MIKLKSLLMEGNFMYHITPKRNLPLMKSQGIVPKPDKSDRFGEKAVYLFDDRTKMEDAMMNWLSDKFPENEPLILLTIDSTGLNIEPSDVGYEVRTHETIPWLNVVKVENV